MSVELLHRDQPTDSKSFEQERPEASTGATITSVAEARGLSLEPRRLNYLVHQVEYRERLQDLGVESKVQFEDNFNHVRVQRHEMTDQPDKVVANVDFTPILDDDEDLVSGSTVAGPEHATEITLMGIQGMQNYALLVEAGLIERPEILYAETNPTMAITAERMGMFSDITRQYGNASNAAHEAIREYEKIPISGTFDEVSARLFSPETRRLEQLLVRRQKTVRPLGSQALQ